MRELAELLADRCKSVSCVRGGLGSAQLHWSQEHSRAAKLIRFEYGCLQQILARTGVAAVVIMVLSGQG